MFAVKWYLHNFALKCGLVYQTLMDYSMPTYVSFVLGYFDLLIHRVIEGVREENLEVTLLSVDFFANGTI